MISLLLRASIAKIAEVSTVIVHPKQIKNQRTLTLLSYSCAMSSSMLPKKQVLQLSDIWQRYQDIAAETETSIPQSFFSRRTSFKEKLVESLGSLFEFVQPLERNKLEREQLLIPRKYSHDVLADYYYSTISNNDMLTMPPYQHDDDAFRSLIHVALQIRGHVIATPGHEGLDIDLAEAAAIDCVPDRLYMFLNVLLRGQTLIDCDSETEGKGSVKHQTLILSLAQDIVYAVSEGKRWTPKHIGLASTLHQLTRSKHLVELFHRAGHILSYKQVLKIDTALAEHTLQSMNRDNGAVVPPNLSSDVFTHYTADNIDINDSTLDGKNTFHATLSGCVAKRSCTRCTTIAIKAIVKCYFENSRNHGKTYTSKYQRG
jgi:hypothetical protein